MYSHTTPSLILAAILATGCCKGDTGRLEVNLVDGLGAEAPADFLYYSLDGGAESEATCLDSGAPCSNFEVPVQDSGAYTVRAVYGEDDTLGEVDITLDCPGDFDESFELKVTWLAE